mmetsp:Transcript_17627/g.57610  ORF Transcript_17627/g.57610 Transcript_17627/m.57610 type:complete len:264 (+) Transcript_17627:31-822(+)
MVRCVAARGRRAREARVAEPRALCNNGLHAFWSGARGARLPSAWKGGPPVGYCSQLRGDHSTPAAGPSTRCSWKVCLDLPVLFARLRWSSVPGKQTRSPARHSTGTKPAAKRSSKREPSASRRSAASKPPSSPPGAALRGRAPSHATGSASGCCSKPIAAVAAPPAAPPAAGGCGCRTKARRTGSWCEPGRTQRQPFVRVASSSASQRPRQVWRGVVKRKVESWWLVTSPPIPACLKMYIDCGTTGLTQPSAPTSSRSLAELE